MNNSYNSIWEYTYILHQSKFCRIKIHQNYVTLHFLYVFDDFFFEYSYVNKKIKWMTSLCVNFVTSIFYFFICLFTSMSSRWLLFFFYSTRFKQFFVPWCFAYIVSISFYYHRYDTRTERKINSECVHFHMCVCVF